MTDRLVAIDWYQSSQKCGSTSHILADHILASIRAWQEYDLQEYVKKQWLNRSDLKKQKRSRLEISPRVAATISPYLLLRDSVVKIQLINARKL